MADEMDKLEKKAKEIFDDLYKKMDGRIRDLADQLKENFLPEAEEKLRKNVFKSVIVSFIIGFVLGLIFSIFGSKRGKKK
jgi:ElaB/YqjD/DUF883 family membrane-anchored ribosome-binding protein